MQNVFLDSVITKGPIQSRVEEWIQYLKGGMGDVQPHHADAAVACQHFTLRGFGCYSETVPIAQARVIDKTMEKQQDG